MKGKRPRALFNKIKIMRGIGTSVRPGAEAAPRMALNSECRKNFKSLNTLVEAEGRAQYRGGMKIKASVAEVQFNARPLKAIGSNTENRFPIN